MEALNNIEILTLYIRCVTIMTEYRWNEDKNKWLKIIRNIGFEDIVDAVEQGNIVEILPNEGKYMHQQVLYVLIGDYIFKVPFVIEQQDEWFLKTIIPSRKATKKYLSK